MPPRKAKSKSKKAKLPVEDRKEDVVEELPGRTEDEAEPVTEVSVDEAGPEKAPSAAEEVQEEKPVDSAPETVSQGLTMEERTDKLKALRLKMVGSLLKD